MSSTPWVHLIVKTIEWDALPRFVRQRFVPDGVSVLLDGRRIESLSQFYREIDIALPLIQGFGMNLDALLDLFRMLGSAEHAGRRHVFVWYRPEIMLEHSPLDFRKVVDIILGASKELLFGEDLDPTFDPADEQDWIPTRLDVLFITPKNGRVVELKESLGVLSDQWDFADRYIEVSVEE